jgi:ABC-type branched-subunit amino acid transport system substrate-binding protein
MRERHRGNRPSQKTEKHKNIIRGETMMNPSRSFAALGFALAMATSAAFAADPIKIGMVVPLTGPIADAGRYGTQGAKLAVEEINQAGGYWAGRSNLSLKTTSR